MEYADRFILKGAMLFIAWEDEPHRHTRDIDFLSLVDEGADDLTLTFGDIRPCRVEPDGLELDADSMAVTPIRSAFDFAGFRAEIKARLGKSRLPPQIDVGFGDSRTKDLCDVRALSRRFAFSGEPLTAAISATFGSRAAAVSLALPITFGEEIALDPAKLTRWGAFVRKARVAPVGLGEVVAALRRFLAEPYLAAARREPFTRHWPAGGPWG